jgi:hypothetical protein
MNEGRIAFEQKLVGTVRRTEVDWYNKEFRDLKPEAQQDKRLNVPAHAA